MRDFLGAMAEENEEIRGDCDVRGRNE